MEGQSTPLAAHSRLRKLVTILTLSLALAIIVIDTTVLNVSIGNLVKDLNTDLKSIQWATTLYSLVVAALTITGGRLGDLFGRKRMFVIGAVIFALGSLLTSFATNIGVLVLGWSVIEGVGAALMMPATASLLVSNFQGRERAIAFGIWGGVAGASAAFGPLLGGYLTTNFSWNWAFRINVVIALFLIAGSFMIKGAQMHVKKVNLDIVGVLLSAVGLAALVYGIIESSTYGWITAKLPYEIAGNVYDLAGISVTAYAIVFGLLVLFGFMLWERRVEKKGDLPLVSLKLFKNRQYVSGITTTAVFALGQAGLFFVLPVFFQVVRGKNAFETGLSTLPMSLALLVAAPLSGALSAKVRPRVLIQVGLMLNALGAIVLYYSLALSADVAQVAPGQILIGAGFGLISSQISNLTLSAVSVEEAGEASGVNAMIRQLGGSLGSAIIGAVFLANLSTSLTTGIEASRVIPGQAKTELVKQVEKNASNFEYGGGAQSQAVANGPLAKEMKSLVDVATVDAGKAVQLYEILFIVLTFAISFSLPNIAGARGKKDQPAGGH